MESTTSAAAALLNSSNSQIQSQPQNSKQMSSVQLGRWNFIHALGSGSTSEVFLAIDPDREELAAIKLTHVSQYEFVKNEVDIHRSLKHQNIIAFEEFYDNLETESTGDGASHISASVLEYAEAGEFLELLQTLDALPEALARTYFLQLLQALEYLHDQGIVHRDVKSDNILLDRNYCLKLTDFSHACRIPRSTKLLSQAGTSKYFAPEVHKSLPYDGPLADIFAAGIILFVMVAGHLPFVDARETDKLYGLIAGGNIEEFWRQHDPNTDLLTFEFKELMQEIFASDPSKRATIDRIKKHPWMVERVLSVEELISFVEKLAYLKGQP